MEKESFISKTVSKAKSAYGYFWSGVWKDPRKNVWTSIVKTLNLTVRSFTDTGLQNKSMSLTYSTVLALVPALALLFAISRGFGFQDMVQNELYVYFPAQQKAISTATSFVDSYLQQSSQGLFVGIGIVMLLWTLISLLSNIEDVFNSIWGIKKARSLPQKVTDYIAICLMVPVLMICSSGASIFMSTIVQDNLNLPFLTPVINNLLELAPLVMAWLAFTLSYFLIPNIKVSFKYAAIAGAVCAIAFQILQLLFVNGQIYVTKYNAIYGSFAFLPLLLIWLQLVWTITLAGAVLCYSSQNIFQFNFSNDISTISLDYKRQIAVVIMAITVKRFDDGRPPLTVTDFAANYHMPSRLITQLIDEMVMARLLSPVAVGEDIYAYQPATDPGKVTLGYVLGKLNSQGANGFIPGFQKEFADIIKVITDNTLRTIDMCDKILLRDLPLDNV